MLLDYFITAISGGTKKGFLTVHTLTAKASILYSLYSKENLFKKSNTDSVQTYL